MQTPVSSGSGDVVLSGGASPEKKSHKGIIILAVFLVLALVLGGIYALWQNGAFRNIGLGGGSEQVATANLEEAYNAYTNYVLFGEENVARPSLEAIEAARPYFEGLETSELDAYVARADEKYGDLELKYGESEVTIGGDMTTLKAFFEDFVKVTLVGEDEILQAYVKGGQEGTRFMISNQYTTANVGNEYLREYLEAENGLAVMRLELIAKAEAAGCVQNGALVKGCYNLTESEGQAFATETIRTVEAKNALYWAAMGELETIYNDLYNPVNAEGEE